MVLLAALHLPLILFVPWTTEWIPATVITPFAMADLYAMLWLLSVVGEFVERPKNSARDSIPTISRASWYRNH